jgi:gp16 family phage-associated protein
MGTQRTNRSTNVNAGVALSGEQAKARLQAKGLTLREFAHKHGLSYRVVSEVVRGVNKARFGEGHRAAVALGMKAGA